MSSKLNVYWDQTGVLHSCIIIVLAVSAFVPPQMVKPRCRSVSVGEQWLQQNRLQPMSASPSRNHCSFRYYSLHQTGCRSWNTLPSAYIQMLEVQLKVGGKRESKGSKVLAVLWPRQPGGVENLSGGIVFIYLHLHPWTKVLVCREYQGSKRSDYTNV